MSIVANGLREKSKKLSFRMTGFYLFGSFAPTHGDGCPSYGLIVDNAGVLYLKIAGGGCG
jgi:hypothetical protein